MEWKPIPGYEGLYEVSDTGLVRSLDRMVNSRFGHRIFKGRVLKPIKDGDGYLWVGLTKHHKQRAMFVHRAVALAFVPGWFEGAVVNHKDEKKDNNIASNLEWCDVRYNTIYGTGIERARMKTINGRNSKPVKQYTLDGRFIKKFPSVAEVRRVLGFSESSVANCCKGITKTSHYYKWRFSE